MPAHLIAEFEALIRRDPARRGLIGSEAEWGPLCPGHLGAAAAHLAAHAQRVAIVTGFFIPRGDPPAAETDGPPGSALLAQSLRLAGAEVFLVTDSNCGSALKAAARALGFPASHVWVADNQSVDLAGDFFDRGPGVSLTHLIALERVGPSHTPESLAAQPRTNPVPLDEFLESVPPEDRNHCHNMRGENIDAFTPALHTLFECIATACPAARTIGIGDGGNELGMGCVPWEELRRRLPGPQAARLPCRIATDWNIIAGTSNWGGYALAAATLLLRGQTELLRPFDREQQHRALRQLVEQGPAVDGVTRGRDCTVDGLPFLTYIQPWEGMRRLLHLAE